MIRILILTLFVLLSHVTWAQEKSVPVKEKFRLFRNKASRITKHDTLKLPAKSSLSHLTSKADSLTENLNKADTHKKAGFVNSSSPTDSVKLKIEAASGNIHGEAGEAQQKIKSATDSLKAPDQLKDLQDKLGTNANIPQSEKTSGNNAVKLSSISNDFSETDQLKVPGNNTLKVDPQFPGVSLPNQTNDLSKTNIPRLDAVDKVKDNLPEHTPNLDKPDSADVKKLTDEALENERVKEYAEPVQEISEKISPYKKNIDSLNVQDATVIAAKEAEGALENTDALKTLTEKPKQAKAGMPAPDVALLQRYQDKRILKDEMLRKSKNVMNNKITSFTPQVKDQQKKLGKAKKMNSSVPSVKNMKDKRVDELKERPFYERIVPGISLQSSNTGVFAIDFAPQVGYRLSTYWTAGAGAVYRVGFDRKYSSFASGQGIYGFRSYIDYRLVRGLFVHAEYERINTVSRFSYSDNSVTKGFNSMYVGLGKRYPISRKFYGGVTALYKIEFQEHLPGTTKFNLRLTFEYRTKKVRKPTAIK